MWAGHRIGICTYRRSFGPAFASRMESGDPWFVGYGLRVTAFDPIDLKVIAESSHQAGAFFAFVAAGAAYPLVGVFEAGVGAYEWRGALAWFQSIDDIITGWRIDGPVLELTCYEGAQIQLALTTGRRV